MSSSPSERSITILYGSETGSAREVAERIARDAKRRHFRVKISALDDYNKANLPNEKLVIFVVATTGQGDPPANMKKFWKFLLRKDLPEDSLANVQFAVFGLGDSSYAKFNFMGRKLNRRLLQLGATSIHDRGDADDQAPNGVDSELVPWLAGLWQKLMQLHPLPTGVEAIPDSSLFPARYHITFVDDGVNNSNSNSSSNNNNNNNNNASIATSTNENTAPPAAAPPVYDANHPFFATVLENRRVTPEDHFQEVRHISLDITGSGIKYEPGDVACIMPQNPLSQVHHILKRLNLDPKQRILVQRVDPDAPELPHWIKARFPITLEELFERYLDIQGTPKRYFFELLSHFTEDEAAKDRLQYFGSADGASELARYNQREKRSFVEVFDDFPSAQPPVDYLLDLIPGIQPRYFSISSAQTMFPNEIHITMVVVSFRTPYKRLRKGVCSSWLAQIPPASSSSATTTTTNGQQQQKQQQQPIKVPLWVQKGQIQLPKDPTAPIVMVGPGTGCAPFRAFIQERALLAAATQQVGKTRLFFGNRNATKDYFYKDEWEAYAAANATTTTATDNNNNNSNNRFDFQIYTAFSRDQDRKIYVQHRIREQGQELFELLTRHNAYFYICGSAKRMPDDVQDAVKEVLKAHGGMSAKQAEDFLRTMELRRRFQCETWS